MTLNNGFCLPLLLHRGRASWGTALAGRHEGLEQLSCLRNLSAAAIVLVAVFCCGGKPPAAAPSLEDEEAVLRVFATTKHWLRRFCLDPVRREETAWDASVDCWRQPVFRSLSEPARHAYVQKAALRRFYGQAFTEDRRKRLLADAGDRFPGVTTETPQEILIAEEERGLFAEFLGTLSLRSRKIIEGRLAGDSFETIAVSLGESSSSVQYQFRKIFRQAVRDLGGRPGKLPSPRLVGLPAAALPQPPGRPLADLPIAPGTGLELVPPVRVVTEVPILPWVGGRPPVPPPGLPPGPKKLPGSPGPHPGFRPPKFFPTPGRPPIP